MPAALMMSTAAPEPGEPARLKDHLRELPANGEVGGVQGRATGHDVRGRLSDFRCRREFFRIRGGLPEAGQERDGDEHGLRPRPVGSGAAAGNTTFLTKSVQYRTRIVRNRLIIIAKDLPLALLARLLPYLVVAEVLMLPYFLIRSPSSIRAFFDGWRQFLGHWRSVWQKRRRIQGAVKVSTDYLWGFFEEI